MAEYVIMLVFALILLGLFWALANGLSTNGTRLVDLVSLDVP